MGQFLLTAAGMFALGMALLFFAFYLLGEYRTFFFHNPRIAMSTEVFAYLAEIGGPGYLAAMLFIAGAMFVAVSLFILVAIPVAMLAS